LQLPTLGHTHSWAPWPGVRPRGRPPRFPSPRYETHMHAVTALVRQRLFGDVRYVALGGGSLLGCMYIGALAELSGGDDAAYTAWARNLRGVAGTSAGSIVALLVATGATPTVMQTMLAACNIGAIAEEAKVATGATLAKWGAVTTGAAVKALLVDVVARACCGLGPTQAACAADLAAAEAITLGELGARGGPALTVVVTNADEGVVEYWNAATRPTMPVWLALRASVAVPGLFPEVVVQGVRFQDGGITCNLPCHLFPAAQTLTLFVHVGGDGCDSSPSGGTRDDHVAGPDAPALPGLMTMVAGGVARAVRTVQVYMCAAQLGPLRGNPALVAGCVPCRAVSACAAMGAGGAFAFHAGPAATSALVADGAASVRSVVARDALLVVLLALATQEDPPGRHVTAGSTDTPAAAAPGDGPTPDHPCGPDPVPLATASPC
jgi:predicted acylesterase/phospholipase RssA